MIWDARSGLSTATYIGHQHAVLSACTSVSGYDAYSVDASGCLIHWDLRHIQQRSTSSVDPTHMIALHDVSLSASSTLASALVATAAEDGIVRVHQPSYSANGSHESMSVVAELSGHDGRVDCVRWDPHGQYLVSGGADGSFRVWS